MRGDPYQVTKCQLNNVWNASFLWFINSNNKKQWDLICIYCLGTLVRFPIAHKIPLLFQKARVFLRRIQFVRVQVLSFKSPSNTAWRVACSPAGDDPMTLGDIQSIFLRGHVCLPVLGSRRLGERGRFPTFLIDLSSRGNIHSVLSQQ